MTEVKLPEQFLNRMRVRLNDEFEDFLKSFEVPVPVSVRINPLKSTDRFKYCEKVTWATNAFYLPERISFTLDPFFHAGCYYVQEASSMFLEQALKIAFADDKPVKILDLCAAPGGKSTHTASLMPEGSLLICNEVINPRNRILQQNITKWGHPNVVITSNDPSDFDRLPGFFDLVIVDAPCSGEGLFRKDHEASNEWSPQSVDRCRIRQSEILDSVNKCLKNDGLLVYSTCTYADEENDMQVQRLLNEDENSFCAFEKVNIPELPGGVVETRYGYQFYPHRVKGEGFYMSLLRKKSGDEGSYAKVKSDFSDRDNKYVNDLLDQSNDFRTYRKSHDLYAIPGEISEDFHVLMKNLYIRQAGILLGSLMKDELIPSHQLSMSASLSKSIPRVSLSESESLSYLRGDAILRPGLAKGWYIVEFKGKPMGWIKSIGNRINNYYPKEFRIIKRY